MREEGVNDCKKGANERKETREETQEYRSTHRDIHAYTWKYH